MLLIEELFGWLKKKGLQPNGAPFFRYWVIGDKNKKFKLEVGIPVVNATFGDERVFLGLLQKENTLLLTTTGILIISMRQLICSKIGRKVVD